MAPPACLCLRVSVAARFSSCGPSRGKVKAGGRQDYFPIKPLPVLARFSRSASPVNSIDRTGTGARLSLQPADAGHFRSEEHTSELQSLMRISYAVFSLYKTTTNRQLIQAQSDIQ